MSELNEKHSVYTLLGELRADVKHILMGLERSRADMEQMREAIDRDFKEVDHRLTKVERFNTKVLAYISVLLPLVLIVLQWGIPALLALI